MIIGLLLAIIVVSLVSAQILMKTKNKVNAYTVVVLWFLATGGLIYWLISFMDSL